MNHEEMCSKYVAEACKIALDPNHGYSQTNREGQPDFDCSSLVIHCLETAGLSVKKYGATYTGNLYGAMKKCGFNLVYDEPQKGDIFLTPKSHVLIYIGDKTVVHAVADENGKAEGKKAGDQTGKEIRIEVVDNLDTYKYHLRLADIASGTKGVVANCYYLNMRERPNSSAKVLSVLSRGIIFDLIKKEEEWAKISVHGKVGYINNNFWEVLK